MSVPDLPTATIRWSTGWINVVRSVGRAAPARPQLRPRDSEIGRHDAERGVHVAVGLVDPHQHEIHAAARGGAGAERGAAEACEHEIPVALGGDSVGACGGDARVVNALASGAEAGVRQACVAVARGGKSEVMAELDLAEVVSAVPATTM